jgi:hypothetical protein
LLGKATTFGLTPYGRDDISRGWGLTAEFGCLRLERLSGEEEVSGERMYLPTPFSHEYGITGGPASPEAARTVFGLVSEELEQIVTALRKGSFPILGYSQADLRCSVSSCTIPGGWPHVITSNLALYGNVVSLETFIRVVVSSLPQGQLGARFPSLQPVFKRLMKLMVLQRRGVPYCKEMLEMESAHSVTTAKV